MTYLEAAIAVLKAAHEPMTATEIAEAALRRGLIQPSGRTPAATMSARLYVYARQASPPVIEREYRPGRIRAERNSVRWRYIG